jgi:hypothetical protein
LKVKKIDTRTQVQGDFSGFLSKSQLVKVKLKAIRAGVWFRALPKIDHALVDLTIKVSDGVRSAFLAQRILLVARKLEGFLESRFARAIREVGLPLARKLSLLAQQWGTPLRLSGRVTWASRGIGRLCSVADLQDLKVNECQLRML